MGNCCIRESSSVVWAGDDWGSVAPGKRHPTLFDGVEVHASNMERQRLLNVEMGGFSSSSASGSFSSSGSTREVKIKITKRELEELMARVDMRGLSMEQALARLANSSYKFEILEHHHRSWKPALQSIPEVN